MSLIDSKPELMSHVCFVKFQSIYSNLKSAEKKAADYCLLYPATIEEIPINEVAEQAGCSCATFVRLARRLGYAGYPELRSNILNTKQEYFVQYNDISEDDDTETITKKVFLSSVQSLQDTLNIVDFVALTKAAGAISAAKRLLFTGSGDANVVAMAGAQKFSRLGFHADFFLDYDSQLVALSQMQKGDVVICVSHSGRTKTAYEIIKYAKEAGITVITITNYPVSPITKNADICLLTATFACDLMGEIITKRIPALCMLEVLYVCILMDSPPSARKILDEGNAFLLKNKI